MINGHYTAAWTVNLICQILMWSLVLRSVLSWFVASNSNAGGLAKFYAVLTTLTEPLVMPFRKLLSKYNSTGMDFAPLAAFFAIMILRKLIISLIYIF